MIFAKINPPASKIEQTNPFSATTITADTITALARPYRLGSESVRFEVQFGTVTLDSNNVVTNFKHVMSLESILNDAQLNGWGTDDSVVLHAIAANLGANIVTILSGTTSNVF